MSTQKIPFEYTTKINKRLKRARLSLKEGGVLVELPGRMNQSELNAWLVECAPKVMKALHSQRQRLSDYPLPIPESICEGAEIPYLGKNLKLRCFPSASKAVKISQQKEQLIVKSSAVITGDQELLNRALKKWYKNQLFDEIDPFLMIFHQKTGLGPEAIRFKDNLTNWGSCSSLNNINLNWRLIFCPKHVLANVVYHELCHLIHRDHSANFYRKLAEFHPEYKKSEEWLNKYGFGLKVILP